ncbi:MAG: hypothetical protein M1816_003471 [Peltula sp. TS41687]|nr:MAG: hypothetical protein M1816_003471 [Peltula sp. TS41687]
MANNAYCLDGLLEEGNTRRYVENVPFKSCRLKIIMTWNSIESGISSGFSLPDKKRRISGINWAPLLPSINDITRISLGLQGLHGHDAQFQAWLKEFGDSDFRRVVAANPEFPYKESVDLDRRNDRQPLWKEVHFKFLTAVGPQRAVNS